MLGEMDDGFDNTASLFNNTIGKIVKLGKTIFLSLCYEETCNCALKHLSIVFCFILLSVPLFSNSLCHYFFSQPRSATQRIHSHSLYFSEQAARVYLLSFNVSFSAALTRSVLYNSRPLSPFASKPCRISAKNKPHMYIYYLLAFCLFVLLVLWF